MEMKDLDVMSAALWRIKAFKDARAHGVQGLTRDDLTPELVECFRRFRTAELALEAARSRVPWLWADWPSPARRRHLTVPAGGGGACTSPTTCGGHGAPAGGGGGGGLSPLVSAMNQMGQTIQGVSETVEEMWTRLGLPGADGAFPAPVKRSDEPRHSIYNGACQACSAKLGYPTGHLR